MTDVITILTLIVAALLIGLVIGFNKLTGLRVRSKNAWSDIDVQLKRRWELIPNLVETVKGYAAHEQGTLEGTIAARSRAQIAKGIADRGTAEQEVARSTHQLIALAEDYPDLKASDLFGKLYADLVEVESHLASARKYYNAVVRDYNTATGQFPSNIIARLGGFEDLAFFQLESDDEANVPTVSMGGRV